MRLHPGILSLVCTLLFLGGEAVASAPRLDALSRSEILPGQFVRLEGGSFGAPGTGGRVEIGGVQAATAHWSDTLITAYARAGVPEGDTTVQVITPEGASATLPLKVLPQPSANGRIAWRFEAEGAYGRHRPTVGEDGTVYFGDIRGFVYAIGADGRVRWIHDGNLSGGASADADRAPVAIGPDGTIYAAVDPVGPENQIHAIAPDGTLSWVHNTNDSTTIAGPSVGPDGNIYVLFPGSAGGLTCLSPDGFVQWTQRGDPFFLESAVWGAEIAFGPSTPNGPVDQLYLATDQSGGGNLNPQESFWGFELGGRMRFRTETGPQSSTYAYYQGQPVVGPDGTIFLSSATTSAIRSVQAYSPEGTLQWFWKHPVADSTSVPAIGPDGAVYVVSGSAMLTALNPDGSVRWDIDLGMAGDQMMHGRPVLHPSGRAVLTASWRIGQPDLGVMALESRATADGSLRWRAEVPLENGYRFTPNGEAAFSADGSRAYLVGSQPGQPTENERWVLFAFDEDACLSEPAGCDPTPDGGSDAGMDPNLPDAGSDPNDPPDAGAPSPDAGGDASAPSPVNPEESASGCSATGAGAFGGVVVLIAALGRRRRGAQGER